MWIYWPHSLRLTGIQLIYMDFGKFMRHRLCRICGPNGHSFAYIVPYRLTDPQLCWIARSWSLTHWSSGCLYRRSSLSVYRLSDGPLVLARICELTGLYLIRIASLFVSSSIWTSASLWGIIGIEIVYVILVNIKRPNGLPLACIAPSLDSLASYF